MKVLVVSHNVFSRTTSMGKTLRSYFLEWDDCELAQFYIHSEIPTDTICKNYYRVTDKEMIRSVFTGKSGRVFGERDIFPGVINPRTDVGNTAKLYRFAGRRTPMIYFMRNLWWRLGNWKTRNFLDWLDEVDPDVVFFAAGDYGFLYKVALEIAVCKGIPLVVSCMDDYYFYNKNEKSLCGRVLHKQFMGQVRKTMDYAACLFLICEKMRKDYSRLLGKPGYTLYTPASIREPLAYGKKNTISYIGNLGYKRDEQLVKLGRALKKIDLPGKPDHIDVYTAERAPEKLRHLTEENGLHDCGSISSEEVLKVMGESLAVIHTESFDASVRKRVAYSVSTKIADSLASGTCLLAYGPEDVASMEYLLQNRAAYCITSEENLEEALLTFLQDEEARRGYAKNGLALARQNHDIIRNCELIKNVLTEISQGADEKG